MDFHRDFWWIRKRIERHAVRSYQYFNPDYARAARLWFAPPFTPPLVDEQRGRVSPFGGVRHGPRVSVGLPTHGLPSRIAPERGLEEKNLRYVVHPTISSVAR